MVRATTDTSAERLFDQLEAGTERSIERTGEDADGARTETLAELVDVVRAIEDLLETVDLERLSDVVEPSALPDLLVPDGVPEAIRERDLDPALDLGALRDVVNLRALWNTVDIVDFRRELDDLKSELEDVVGPDAFDSAADSETAADISAFVGGVKPEATNAALQQEAGTAAERGPRGTREVRATVRTDGARLRLRRAPFGLEQSDGGLVGAVRPAADRRLDEGVDRPVERPVRENRRATADIRPALAERPPEMRGATLPSRLVGSTATRRRR